MTDSGGDRAQPAADSRSVEMASLLSGYVGRYAIPLLLIAELVLFSVLRPESFATINNFRAILDRETVLVLLAFAAMMPLIVGEFDLSVASNLSFAQLIVVGFAVNQAFPAPLALICALAVGMFIGLVNGVAVVKLKVPSIVATLATGTILEGVSLRYSSRTILGAPDPLTTVFRKRVFEGASGGLPLTVVYALVIALVVWFVLAGMPTGRRMYAVGGNRRAAELSGIRSDRMVIGTFVVAGLLASAGGAMLGGRIGTGTPSTGLTLLIPAFAAVFLGATTIRPGRYNVWGAVLAVYTIEVAISGLQQVGVGKWIEKVVEGGALLGAIALSGWALRMRARKARERELAILARTEEKEGGTDGV